MKKWLSVLLILILCLSFIACTAEPPTSGEEETTSDDVASKPSGDKSKADEPSEEEKDPERDPLAPSLNDYAGYTYKIRSTTDNENEILAPTERNGQAINELTYKRNETVAEEYNVTIVEERHESGATLLGALSQAEITNTYLADLILADARTMFACIYEGAFVNLSDNKVMDMTKSYWDQTYRKATTILDISYTFTGDLHTADELHTRVIVLNNSLFEDLHSPKEYIYGVVMDDDWTMEKFFGYWQSTSLDNGTKGVLEDGDRVGFAYDSQTGIDVFTACGIPTFTVSDDSLTLNFTSQKASEIVAVMYNFIAADNGLVLELVKEDTSFNAAAVAEHFANGRILFRNDTLAGAMAYALDMEDEVYYLPYPKYDNKQKDYKNAVSFDFEPMAIHENVADLERTGRITEALAFYSAKLTDEVIEWVIQDQLGKEEEPRELLRMALDAKTYDVDHLTNTTTFTDRFVSLMETNTLAQYAQQMSMAASGAINDRGNGTLQIFLARYVAAAMD